MLPDERSEWLLRHPLAGSGILALVMFLLLALPLSLLLAASLTVRLGVAGAAGATGWVAGYLKARKLALDPSDG
jgi:hypothetical protein